MDFNWVGLVLCVGSKLLIIISIADCFVHQCDLAQIELITAPLKAYALGWSLCIHGVVVLHRLGINLVRRPARLPQSRRVVLYLQDKILGSSSYNGGVIVLWDSDY